jgi:hypothetical protein
MAQRDRGQVQARIDERSVVGSGMGASSEHIDESMDRGSHTRYALLKNIILLEHRPNKLLGVIVHNQDLPS